MELREVLEVGKSSACKELQKILKAEIIDADKIAKDLTSKSSEYLLEIVKVFGNRILNENGSLNRQALASIIYNDFKSKENLDKLTFKFVCKEIETEIKKLKDNKICEYILIDAPLLIESNLNKICNFVISVIANEDKKIERICLRDGVSEEIAYKRLAIQQDDNYYISNSDFNIKNNEEKTNLEKQIKEICIKIINKK